MTPHDSNHKYRLTCALLSWAPARSSTTATRAISLSAIALALHVLVSKVGGDAPIQVLTLEPRNQVQ